MTAGTGGALGPLYLPAELARLNPDVDTLPFWEACRRRELRIQRCGTCGRFRHPPRAGCPSCGSMDIQWIPVTGRGRVFSYTIVHHAVSPEAAAAVPYNVIVVELEDAPGVRLISNLLDTPPLEIHIGMAVELVWQTVDAQVVLPRYRPVPAKPEGTKR